MIETVNSDTVSSSTKVFLIRRSAAESSTEEELGGRFHLDYADAGPNYNERSGIPLPSTPPTPPLPPVPSPQGS